MNASRNSMCDKTAMNGNVLFYTSMLELNGIELTFHLIKVTLKALLPFFVGKLYELVDCLRTIR